VNLLLIEPTELDGATAVLTGRRAAAVRDVLRAAVGARLRAGVVLGPVGVAEVTAITADAVTVRFEPAGDAAAAPPMAVELVLAVPRPKVLRRALQTAASVGVRRIDLVNAWRVDKSYLGSARLDAAAIAEDLRLGAEQGETTWIPDVRVHDRFMGWLDQAAPPARRLCAHARGGPPLEAALPPGAQDDVALAIGPEGGWIEREVETFAARGWTVVSLGAAILRVEAALASALGQIALLRRLPPR
jgi:RsmE family RNA methyltransferase